MIEVGKKYCPVCVADNGKGDDPVGAMLGKTMQPCRYPWQTPIGVLLEEPRQVGQVKPAEIMIRGTFELYWNNDVSHPPEETPDIYGCDLYTSMIGVRVYYDAKNGVYVTEHATNVRLAGSQPFYWGQYPGSATVGYISAVRVDGDNNAGWVTITIDPRPARATYRIANSTSQSLYIGDRVTISSPENVITEYDPERFPELSLHCDGVVVAVIGESETGNENDPPTKVIVCTSGPAWVFPKQEQLYNKCSYSQITAHESLPDNIPIDANLAFRPFSNYVDTIPRLGFAHLKQWYNYESSTTEYQMIIDINLGNPTGTGSGTQAIDVTDIRYYDDPEDDVTNNGGRK